MTHFGEGWEEGVQNTGAVRALCAVLQWVFEKLWGEKSPSWISDCPETASHKLKWSTWSIRETYLKVAEKKGSWTWSGLHGVLVWSRVFPDLLKWGCCCILKLSILDTPFHLHLKVWDGKLLLELWKLCNLVFLLSSCRDFTRVRVKCDCMPSVPFIQGAGALDKAWLNLDRLLW